MILSVGFTHQEVLYILAFYTIGAILGFFSFRFSYNKTISQNLLNGLVTVCLGVFLAYIIANYLEEEHIFSKAMNMLVGGLGSFGLPDIVIKYYPRLSHKAVQTVMNKDIKGK